ncbi:MAG: tetratricopeptide repeat protein [Nitrospirae bacterium]|nr:tetratricopeptide repeat protein [Nitrospirota bacterium]
MADKNAIMKEAQKYLMRGQVDKAIAEWEKLPRDAHDGNTYNIIGDLYLKKGDKKNSVEFFHKSAFFFRQEGFSLKALALYKKLLNINPVDSEALNSLGQLSEEKGLTTDAIKYYLATADSLAKEGKKDSILDIYEKILSLSPANIPLRNKVAEIFFKEGLSTDAAREYIQVGRLYDEKGDSENAKAYYQKALGINPLNKEAILGIGNIFEKSGDIQRAVRHLKEASTLFPDDAEILFMYAEFTLRAGQTETARESLARIIELDPDNVKPRRLLGELYLKEGEREKAWGEFLPVIDEMIMEQKYEDAIKLLEPFKEIDPFETGKRLVSLFRQLGESDHVAEELISLGDAFRTKGMEDEAAAFYRDALELRPDDLSLQELIGELTKEPEPEMEPAKEPVTIHIREGEKTPEEIFIETDIFSRYGLLNEAIRLLEGLKVREPQNIDVHTRLKALYVDNADKESAVTECLILHELYRRTGDLGNSEKIIGEALDLYPEDPRLSERGFRPSLEEKATYDPSGAAEFAEGGTAGPNIEDYEEEIAEADFYSRQGLAQEAEKILSRLHSLFPDNGEIRERLDNLGQISEAAETQEMPDTFEIREEPAAETVFQELTPPGMTTSEIPSSDIITPEEEITEPAGKRPEKGEYEEFVFTDQDLVDAQEMPEPALDNDVLEIFHEFKKGLEKELGSEDSETHYNLGIAYKEMGLIDDAIKEFQTSRNDPKRLLQSSTMLGVCYMEKGLYSLAIDVLLKALKELPEKDESYWAISYDLAEAYEKNDNLREAMDLYTGVYGWNARFRGVSEKLTHIKTRLLKSGEAEKPDEKPRERKDRVSYL